MATGTRELTLTPRRFSRPVSGETFTFAAGRMALPGILGARLARKSVIPGPLRFGPWEPPRRPFGQRPSLDKMLCEWPGTVNGTRGQGEPMVSTGVSNRDSKKQGYLEILADEGRDSSASAIEAM